jgi:hypothetical protein
MKLKEFQCRSSIKNWYCLDLGGCVTYKTGFELDDWIY